MFKTKNSVLKAPARYYNHKQKQHEYSNNFRSKKIENDILIKPSSGYEKQIDYRFETEEEIETEEQCRKVQNKASFQKKNNSFSSSGPDVQITYDHKKKDKKQLKFYCCDSLAIRPSGNASCLEQSKIAQQQLSMYSSIAPKKQPHEQTTSHEGIVQKSKLLTLKPQSRHKRKIFENVPKLNKSKLAQQLPFALLPTEVQRKFGNKNRQQIQDQFHIIIEADEITQCCL